MHHKHKHLIAILGTLSLLLGVVTSVAPYPRHEAEAVYFSPLNNYRPKDHGIIRKDGVWHTYAIYVCIDQTPPCNTTPRGLMHFTSTDLTNWTEQGYVIPPGSPGAWDDYDTWAPSIVERNGTYYMFYTGVDQNGFGTLVQKIGIATSTDLNTWVKYGSNPVINCDNFTWAYWDETNSSDGAACRDPYVFWDNAEHQWVMLLSGRTNAGTMIIAIATSEDLLTWREYGTIATTANGTAESAHYIEHNGTHYVVYTDNQTIDLKYVSSSTSLYTGYGAETVTSLEDNAYASEYYKDADGREYFTRVDGFTNQRLDFDEVVWTGSPFTVQEPSFGRVGDLIWNDNDGDGSVDAGEEGIDNVTLKLYLDDGDGLFDVNSDDLYSTKTSGDDPNTGGTQHGYFQFTNVIPDTYWVHIDPTNYQGGGALAGKVATTSNTTTSVTVSDNQTIANIDIGVVAAGTTWSLTTGSNFTFNSDATLSGGRATTAVTGGTPGWWDNNWQYRRQVTVTAATEILTTTHTADLAYDVAALVTAGKVQADFDDLRLVWWNGSANVEVDLDVLDSDTQRFKIQSQINASGSDGNYYLYFGNPDVAARPTQLANVYDYYASFNATNGTTYGSWQETGDTLWEISSNKMRYNNTVAFNRFIRDPSKTVDLTNDYNVEAKMTINSGRIGGLTLTDTDATFTENLADAYFLNVDAPNDVIQFFHNQFGQIQSNVAFAGISTATEYRTRFEYDYLSSGLCLLRAYLNDTFAAQVAEIPCGQNIFHNDGSDNAHFGLNTYDSNATFNDLVGFQRHDGSVTVASTETSLYPTRTGTVQPINGQSVTFDRLMAFRVSSLDQGGSVRFILSNDTGSSWMYHNGSTWVSSNGTAGQANTAAEIHSQASSFPAGSNSLLWRAILTSSGNQFPTLLHVAATTNLKPATPNLLTPTNGASVTVFQPSLTFSTTDPDSDSLQYELQIDTVNTFDSVDLRTIVQSSSQAGWSGQDAGSGTRYVSGTTATHIPVTALGNGTYYWRARAIDPVGANTVSTYSATSSFITPAAHVISNIIATEVSSTAQQITWTTSNAGSSKLEFGLTTAYGTTVEAGTAATSHSLLMANLVAGSTYHYRVVSTDIFNQTTTSSDQTVVVGSGAFTLTNVSAAVNGTTTVVSWTSSVAGTSLVRYGTTTAYGASVSGSTPATSHSLTLTGLAPTTTYHFSVSTTDTFGGTVSSSNATFSTGGSIGISNVQVAVRKPLSVTLTWETDAASTSRIIYGQTVRLGSEVETTLNTTSHRFTILGLTPGTTYYYQIVARADGAAATPMATFRTLPRPKGRAIPPTILSVTRVRTVPQTIDVTGIARGGQSVAIYIDGQLRRRVTVRGTSASVRSFATRIRSVLLTPGLHTITAQSTDAVGRTSIIRQRVSVRF